MPEAEPRRIHRKRTRGFNLQAASTNPNGVVVVTRPGPYGNPFAVGQVYIPTDSFYQVYSRYLDEGRVTAENCLTAFRAYCEKVLALDPDWLEPLRGKDLACWCPEDSACHASVLLELANG
jgi:hypothetical protein